MRILIVSVVLLFLPTIAFAEVWVCTMGEGEYTSVFREVDGKYEEETRVNETNETLAKQTNEVFKETIIKTILIKRYEKLLRLKIFLTLFKKKLHVIIVSKIWRATIISKFLLNKLIIDEYPTDLTES